MAEADDTRVSPEAEIRALAERLRRAIGRADYARGSSVWSRETIIAVQKVDEAEMWVMRAFREAAR